MFKRFARSTPSSAPAATSIGSFAPVYLVGHLGEDPATVHQGERVMRLDAALRPVLQQLRAGIQHDELVALLGQDGAQLVQDLLAQEVVVIDPTEDRRIYARLTMRGQLQTVHTEHKSAVQARSVSGVEALLSASTYALLQHCARGLTLAQGCGAGGRRAGHRRRQGGPATGHGHGRPGAAGCRAALGALADFQPHRPGLLRVGAFRADEAAPRLGSMLSTIRGAPARAVLGPVASATQIRRTP